MLELPGPEVFSAVVDRIETGVYVLDGSGRIVYWNHGAEKITGLRTQEMLGGPCVSNLGLEEIEHYPAVCVHVCPLERNEGEPRRDATVSMRHRSGHLLRERLWTMAIRNAAEEIVGAAKVFSEWVNATEGSVQQKAGMGEEAHGESRLPGRAAISWWGDRLSLKVSARGAFLEAGDTVARTLHRPRERGATPYAGQRDGSGPGDASARVRGSTVAQGRQSGRSLEPEDHGDRAIHAQGWKRFKERGIRG
jgi:PAS domain S-box-containing protein